MAPPPPVSTQDLLAEAGWLRTLAGHLVRDSAAADDLAQGTLAVALERPPASGRPLRPWLAGVLRNLVRVGRRDDVRRANREQRSARSEALEPRDDALAQFEEQRRLVELVAALDPLYREVIIQRFYRGESAAEIARSSGRPAATVRSQLARGLSQLRAMHRAAHGGDPRRARAALGLAAGFPMTPTVAQVGPSSIQLDLLTMKTSTKLAALAVVSLSLVAGLYGISSSGPELENPPRADAAREHTVPASTLSRESGGTVVVSAAERTEVEAPELTASAPPSVATASRTGFALRAVDEHGQAIAGARISIVARSGMPLELESSAPSSADGRIEFELPPNACFTYSGDEQRLTSLLLAAPAYASRPWIEVVAQGEITELGDRRLDPGASIRGHVLDADGLGVADAELVALLTQQTLPTTIGNRASFGGGIGSVGDNDSALRAMSRSDGAFYLEGLPVGAIQLGYRRGADPWQLGEPLDLAAGDERTGIELIFPRLAPEELITGRVLLPDGAPAADAIVRYRAASIWNRVKIPVRADGRFELRTKSGTALELCAFHPSAPYGPSRAVAAKAGDDDVLLRLIPEQRLRVIVREKDGEPLESACMRVMLRGQGIISGIEQCDSSGVCEALLPDEDFSLRVACPGFFPKDLGPFDADALPEELTVHLEREPALAGVVLADGRPLTGAMVQAANVMAMRYKGFTSRFYTNRLAVTTDDEGRFAIPMSDPGDAEYALLVDLEGHARGEYWIGRIENVEEMPEITIELTAGGSLEGRVLTPSKLSPEGVVIAISRDDGMPLVTRVDAEGRYHFEHLSPGLWRIEDRRKMPEGRSRATRDSGEEPFEPNITIQEGETTTHDIDLRWQEGLVVMGRLVIGERPAAGWVASLRPEDQDASAQVLAGVTLDADGRFELPAVPGRATLFLQSNSEADAWVLEQRVLVDASRSPVEIVLPTGTLGGAGIDPGWELCVILMGTDDRSITIKLEADDEGGFELELPAGAYLVRGYGTDQDGVGWLRLGRGIVGAGDAIEMTPLEESR